jgi:hypothetical protein
LLSEVNDSDKRMLVDHGSVSLDPSHVAKQLLKAKIVEALDASKIKIRTNAEKSIEALWRLVKSATQQ